MDGCDLQTDGPQDGYDVQIEERKDGWSPRRIYGLLIEGQTAGWTERQTRCTDSGTG